MGDAVLGGCAHGGFGVEGDAEARFQQHGQVVRAVADGQCGTERQVFLRTMLQQGCALAFLVEDGLDDFAGQAAMGDFEVVGFVGIEADFGGDAAGEIAESARYQHAMRAARFHGLDQRAGAGHEGDAGVEHVFQCGFGQVFEQRHALAQGGFEIQLTVHGALGDFADQFFQAHAISQFVDAFLLDHGGVHVGNQQLFFAALHWLENEIDPGSGEFSQQRGDGLLRQENIGGDALLQPLPLRCIEQRGNVGHGIQLGGNQGQYMGHGNRIAVVMGATASGKSALALRVAQQVPAVIINADAMQLYADLRVLTARPSVAEEAQAKHALYGVLLATEPSSVAVWLELVEPVIRRAWAEGRLPLVVGGTGMYLKGLMEGIAPIPPVPEAVRGALRSLPETEVRARLEQRDPAMAATLKPGDSQRNLRALEVLDATGESLLSWQQRGNVRIVPEADFAVFTLAMPRAAIYQRIDQRFEAMLAAGALEEARALLALNLPPTLPVTRAVGVPELTAYLRGEMGLEAAIAKAQQHSRNYAKRQLTWMRNQLPQAVPVTAAADPKIFTGSS